ncbi:tRNA (N6-isopentenyl adenosine(37)-C2)-methylthiotransferase MiaB [Syntrophotalea acetylenica]|uniref:tRNA-2-methylthio-N(6)-dimethylallyladenosine synthase n=1 Tax=Syntrophotalea acetylenica TaxID=29542 RepID=A0A1L3GKB9_SYNAC|nr:tRNA (N6-isopentenyl adenosine(37)-C2)-methylthiotransferase MiaB [Syntrophotalea acetylenica]APG45362.1 tRNA (N6-isopentenyl adenosine(37)-C2)-methylthiotransferase MiaB [Syntrophotalea acetylenica]
MSRMKTFYLETFGCQMNVVDSEQIVGIARQLDYVLVDSPDRADLIVLNTCTIRARAERKVYGHLGRFKPLKQQRPSLIVAVCGCVAQQEGRRMLEKTPHLDIVCGTHNLHLFADMLRRVQTRRERCAEVSFLDAGQRRRLFPERLPSDEVTRFVTVIQGCDNFCTYCIVPHVRGREVSRPSAEVLEEVRALMRQGVREITLVGQNVNSYGCKEGDEISFAALLRQINAVEGLERIRFMTSHPKDLSDELVACFGELEKLCKHIHLPVQAGANSVLRAMRRGYSREQYLDRIARLRQVCPEIRVTSDVIVGFPGETGADFEQTMDLLRQVRYAEIYTFLYSARPGTAAAELPDDTPATLKQERFDRMLALQEEITGNYHESDVGRVLPVLVEGSSRQGSGQLFGRTTWNRIVNFDGDAALIGHVVPVRLVRAFRNSHLGELA